MGIFSNVLLVSDYDDTMTEPGGLPGKDGKISKMTTVPQINLDAIRAFEQEGGLFTIASGRTKIYYDNVIRQVIVPNAPLILANGSHIYDPIKDRDVLVRPMPDGVVALAKDAIARFPEVALQAQRTDNMCILHCAQKDRDYYMNLPFHVEGDADSYPYPWVKLHFSGPHAHIAALMEYLQAHYKEYEYAESVPTVCEMQALGVTKGDAARWLANRLGRKILVCVGDAPNDLPMLDEADYAFVTESGFDVMREMGFFRAAEARKGAVADVIRQMHTLLKKQNRNI